jgi:hypothetical protein
LKKGINIFQDYDQLTDQAKLLANSEASDDDGDEPRVESVGARRGLGLEDHQLKTS